MYLVLTGIQNSLPDVMTEEGCLDIRDGIAQVCYLLRLCQQCPLVIFAIRDQTGFLMLPLLGPAAIRHGHRSPFFSIHLL